MPKDVRFRYKCKAKERKLGLFARSIKKRKISTLSAPMLSYLGTIDRDDPTLDEIAEVFPDAVARHRSSNGPSVRGLGELIRDGTVSEADVRAHLSEDLSERLTEDWVLTNSVYQCKPCVFDILLIHPDIRRFVDRCEFLFALINNSNDALILHLKRHGSRLGINMQAHERNLVAHIMASAVNNKNNILFSSHFALIALRHLPFTVEELERVWPMCLQEMNMDAVEAIDHILGV